MRNNIIFDDKKFNKNNFYKNKKLFNIYDIDVDKILISKKEPYGKKANLNTVLDIMIMMSLELFLIVIRQCILRLTIIDC